MSETVKTTDGHQGELLCIKGNTAFIKENNGKVWYCPKTDIIENYDKKDYQIRNLQSQLDHQKVMWNELKEHISNQIIHYDELSDKFKEENNNGCVLLANSKRSMIEEILYKMQELEKGEKNEDKNE